MPLMIELNYSLKLFRKEWLVAKGTKQNYNFKTTLKIWYFNKLSVVYNYQTTDESTLNQSM